MGLFSPASIEAFFGAVLLLIIPDWTKAIVTTMDPLVPVINETFLEFAQTRHFTCASPSAANSSRYIRAATGWPLDQPEHFPPVRALDTASPPPFFGGTR